MKNKSMFHGLMIVLVIGIISGCASFQANIFNSEKIATDAATQATHDFNLWYATATNGAAADKIATLNSQRDTLYQTDIALSKTLGTLDGLRLAYAAQPSTNGLNAINATLAAIASQSSNIVSLVNFYKNQP